MAFLVRNFQRRAIFYSLLRTTQARQAHWLPDYMPGPYPTTKEERERAAKKYNLLPEEYEPYPLDEDPVGDYPKLPFVSVDAKDPLYNWDDPELRRDYNEAVHRKIKILMRDGLSSDIPALQVFKEALICILLLTSFGMVCWYSHRWKVVDPATEKQYPYSGKTYYTFEIEADNKVPKPNKTKAPRQGEAQTPRSIDSNKNSSGESDLSQLTENFCQMTFHNKHSNMRDRQDSNEIADQEMDSPANRLNPKRYSKNRKSFTGFFPPEDIVEIDPAEMKQLQQEQQQKSQHVNLPQQPLNIQSVIRRYPGTYNGNPGYMATRPIITGIPNQGMSPQGLQQALSPQGIPQQALSPQVPGLQTIELQQGPLAPQPNFVPPMFIDMDPHYGPSEMMGAYTGYAPYSASQPGEMYQPSGGITYYNTECQNSNQIRPPPARRQKAAIPIVPPPE